MSSRPATRLNCGTTIYCFIKIHKPMQTVRSFVQHCVILSNKLPTNRLCARTHVSHLYLGSNPTRHQQHHTTITNTNSTSHSFSAITVISLN